MRWTVWGAAVFGTALGVIAAAALAQQTGPVATYWVSATTSSGLGAGLKGAVRGGGVSALLGVVSGRAFDPNAVNHSLLLQLGSNQASAGTPLGEHDPSPALGMGPSLPLTSPAPIAVSAARAPEPPAPEEPSSPAPRPRGRILIFWGCGAHAPAGQPVVFDASTFGPGMPLPRLQGALVVRGENPPSPARFTTYGRWPNEKSGTPVPAQASLQGPHLVRSDYSPDIRFTLGPGMDFMPPLGLHALGRTEEGAVRLGWTPLGQATGYHLAFFGGQGGRGGDGEIVFWSSSAVQPGLMGAGLMDFLPPGEVARLVAEGAVLRPDAQECLVPAEVARAASGGVVSMIAYGPEADFADPPRPLHGPWAVRWTAKVRLKSTTTLFLTPSGDGSFADAPPPAPRRPGLTDVLGGFLPIPH